MLVLSRNVEESIIVTHPSGPVEIKVVKVLGGKVKLGINAPTDVIVDRKEVHDRKMAS
jgi:carbon storage regulator CsrA